MKFICFSSLLYDVMWRFVTYRKFKLLLWRHDFARRFRMNVKRLVTTNDRVTHATSVTHALGYRENAWNEYSLKSLIFYKAKIFSI